MSEAFREWCIVELMGHQRLAGLVSEITLAGAGMLRVDVPRQDGSMSTSYVRPETLYRLTPTTEELARQVARLGMPEPVHRYELPAPAPTPAPAGYRGEFGDARDPDDHTDAEVNSDDREEIPI